LAPLGLSSRLVCHKSVITPCVALAAGNLFFSILEGFDAMLLLFLILSASVSGYLRPSEESEDTTSKSPLCHLPPPESSLVEEDVCFSLLNLVLVALLGGRQLSSVLLVVLEVLARRGPISPFEAPTFCVSLFSMSIIVMAPVLVADAKAKMGLDPSEWKLWNNSSVFADYQRLFYSLGFCIDGWKFRPKYMS
jgi:hypothetical protein